MYWNLASRGYLSEELPGSSFSCLRLVHNCYLHIGVKCYGSLEFLSTVYIKYNGKLVMMLYVRNYVERILIVSIHFIKKSSSLNLLQTILLCQLNP